MSNSSVIKRHIIEFGAAMSAYCLVVIVSTVLLQAYPHAAWRLPLALTPLIPTGVALLAFVRYLHDADEMQQRLQLQAIGFSFAATGLLTFAYGFLQNIGAPSVSWLFVLPLMIALWGVGSALAAWRYR